MNAGAEGKQPEMLSRIHHADTAGLELVRDAKSVRLRLSRRWILYVVFQIAVVSLVSGLILWDGFSKGYLRGLHPGLWVLVAMIFVLAAGLPAWMKHRRHKVIGDHVIRYDLETRTFTGTYFKDVKAADVDGFRVVSAGKGEDKVHEVQVRLKGEGNRRLLVYPSALRLDTGKVYEAFREFADETGQSFVG